MLADVGMLDEIRRAMTESGGWLLGGGTGRMFYLYRAAQRSGSRFWSWILIPELMIGFGMGYLGGAIAEALGVVGPAANGAAGVAGWLGPYCVEFYGRRFLDKWFGGPK